MELLDYLDGWVRDYQGPPEVVVGLFHGPEQGECVVRWLTAEGPRAFGSLTLWQSGDLAVEVYDCGTGGDLSTYRGRVGHVGELAPHLDALVGLAAGDPKVGSSDRYWPATRSQLDDDPRSPRRLRF